MTGPMSSQRLREELAAHLDTVTPPPAALDEVRRRSRRAEVRRTVGPGLLVAAAVGLGAIMLSQNEAPSGGSLGDEAKVATGGPVDLSKGLRAYASPDEKLYMGGRELPYTGEALDTEASATAHGIVYYDEDGSPWLLSPRGTRLQLDAGPSDRADGFSPTVKADAAKPHVAFAVMDGEGVTITVYDLENRSVVATHGTVCSDGCSDFVIDGIDSGAVFVRTMSRTFVWDYVSDRVYPFAGPETRVADVRNGVVLYDGPPPSTAVRGWRHLAGPIDAQLSFDGEHVLSWSEKLEPTSPGGTPLKLDLPVPATFFAFDTDGSVLAATVNDPVRVFDCKLPSGSCEALGEMSTTHGDPMFIGADM